MTVVERQLVWQNVDKTDAATRSVSLDPRRPSRCWSNRASSSAPIVTRRGPRGVGDPHGPLVLADALGRPIRPDRLCRRFVAIAARARLPRLDVHGLRHSYATAVSAAIDGTEYVSTKFATYASRAGLPHIGGPHGLRHSLASALDTNGKGLATISALLGHASTAVTSKVYAHMLKGADRAAVDRHAQRS